MNDTDNLPGVVHLKNLPIALQEEQLLPFFEQFGEIYQLKLLRSPKTGNSLRRAFIEFESSEVAKIVADTMNNYVTQESLIKCKFIGHAPHLFAKRVFTIKKGFEESNMLYNKERTKLEVYQWHQKNVGRLQKCIEHLQSMGIQYDFPGIAEGLKVLKECRKNNMHIDPLNPDGDDEKQAETAENRKRKRKDSLESDSEESEVNDSIDNSDGEEEDEEVEESSEEEVSMDEGMDVNDSDLEYAMNSESDEDMFSTSFHKDTSSFIEIEGSGEEEEPEDRKKKSKKRKETEKMKKKMAKEAAEKTPKQAPKKVSKKDTPEQTLRQTSKQATKPVLKTPKQTPKQLSRNTPKETLKQTPKQISKKTPKHVDTPRPDIDMGKKRKIKTPKGPPTGGFLSTDYQPTPPLKKIKTPKSTSAKKSKPSSAKKIKSPKIF